MEADGNDEYSNSEDDAASNMSDSDVESVEDQEDTFHYESSSSSDDVDSESDMDTYSFELCKRFKVFSCEFH